MKSFDALCLLTKSQIDTILAVNAINNKDFDITDRRAIAVIEDNILKESMGSAITMLAKLTVIDNPKNDQCQASVRELVRILGRRLNVNVQEDFGVPIYE